MDIYKKIETRLGEKIISGKEVSGGDIAQSEVIVMASGRQCFLKTGARNRRMFPAEANSLKELSRAKALRIPDVIHVDPDFLLIEYISSGRSDADFFENFGRQFAQLHRFESETFGFFEDNFIGHTPQENIPSKEQARNWTKFYFEKRLLYQFKLAEKQGLSSSDLRNGFHKLEAKIDTIIPQTNEKPCLLHGDLWSGNYLVDATGDPVIIDPAVYYGHREADLAMTKLFGGFSAAFYAAYDEAYPLAEGHADRENIYILYHVLNHLNLFGMGYHGQAVNLIRSYL